MKYNVTYLISLFAPPSTGDYREDEEYDEDGGEDDGEGGAWWRVMMTSEECLHATNQPVLRPPPDCVVQIQHLHFILKNKNTVINTDTLFLEVGLQTFFFIRINTFSMSHLQVSGIL